MYELVVPKLIIHANPFSNLQHVCDSPNICHSIPFFKDKRTKSTIRAYFSYTIKLLSDIARQDILYEKL